MCGPGASTPVATNAAAAASSRASSLRRASARRRGTSSVRATSPLSPLSVGTVFRIVLRGTTFRLCMVPAERTSDMPRPSFGIVTAPQQVTYDDVLRVWREAEALPPIEHAGLFDPLL